MYSWIKKCVTILQLICIKLIKMSPVQIPKHIAIIMDGNRRYSKRINSKLTVGHSKGSDVLSDTMQWCIDLGIEQLTVYAFSIENFKRSEEEVTALMDLTRDKFQSFQDNMFAQVSAEGLLIKKCSSANEITVELVGPLKLSHQYHECIFDLFTRTFFIKRPFTCTLAARSDRIHRSGIRVNVVGRLSLLPSDMQSSMSRIMIATRNNKTLRVNIAFAYTARDEISRAASHIVDAVKNKELAPEDIDADLISQTLDLGEPELLIRTSGEVRLSDFMLWQVSNTVLYFTEVLWPEFNIWNLFAAIIYFQRQVPSSKAEERISETKRNFLNNLERKRWQEVEKFVSC